MENQLENLASRLVAERTRQIEELNYTHERDRQYTKGELAGAAAMYFLPKTQRTAINQVMALHGPPFSVWPWAEAYFKPDQTETHLGRLRELTKAGALLLAEMERIYQRAYDAVVDVVPEESGLNYTQWVESIKQYCLLELVYGFTKTTTDELAGDVDPESDNWHDYYESGLTARQAFEEMYYEQTSSST